MGHRPALGGHRAPLRGRRRRSGCAARCAVEHSLARRGAEQLWELLHAETYVNALGAMTGDQAVEMVKAGLKAIYLSGWQVAADANLSEQVYPDQSLYAGQQRPDRGAPHQQRAAPRRSDRVGRGDGTAITSRATGSCRSSPTPRPASAVR